MTKLNSVTNLWFFKIKFKANILSIWMHLFNIEVFILFRLIEKSRPGE